MILQKIIGLSILLFSSLQEPVRYNVVYYKEVVQDLNDKENPVKSEMVLSVGQNSSRFCPMSAYKMHTKKLIKKEPDVVMQSSNTKLVVGKPLLIVSQSGVQHSEQLVKDFSTNKVDKVGIIGMKEYYVQNEIPQIKWEIKESSKVILGYNCQEAVGQLAGREYHVWFTTELPFQDGPWLLNGLPGLILEAVDSKGEISFKAKSISENTNVNEIVDSIYDYSKCIKIKEKDYRKTVEMFIKDPIAYSQAQVQGTSVVNEDGGKAGEVRKVKKYNPIELD